MDFEKQIQTDRESLIQDIMKLVSIDSVETAPDAVMPFGAALPKHLTAFSKRQNPLVLKQKILITMPDTQIMGIRKKLSESSVMLTWFHAVAAGYVIRLNRKSLTESCMVVAYLMIKVLFLPASMQSRF